jgi:hypothetical protein
MNQIHEIRVEDIQQSHNNTFVLTSFPSFLNRRILDVWMQWGYQRTEPMERLDDERALACHIYDTDHDEMVVYTRDANMVAIYMSRRRNCWVIWSGCQCFMIRGVVASMYFLVRFLARFFPASIHIVTHLREHLREKNFGFSIIPDLVYDGSPLAYIIRLELPLIAVASIPNIYNRFYLPTLHLREWRHEATLMHDNVWENMHYPNGHTGFGHNSPLRIYDYVDHVNH